MRLATEPYADAKFAPTDIGIVTALTSAQIDTAFATATGGAAINGSTATAALGAATVFLVRRAGKWNTTAFTVIA